MVAKEILTEFEQLDEALVAKRARSPHYDFWVEDQWHHWKRLLRALGKSVCVRAAIEALEEVVNPSNQNLAGTGKLPPDVHDKISTRLHDGIIAWLHDDDTSTRTELGDALASLANAATTQRAKYSFQVVSSSSQLVDAVASVAAAAIATSSFEKHIRTAFVRADSLDTYTSARFRETLARLITRRSPTMSASWLRFPIYVNGQKHFDANSSDELTTADAYDRMDCVFNNIEFCFAEGRMMDITIFDRLDTLRDQIRDNLVPPFAQIEDLVDSIGSRYGFDEISHSDSMWIRRDDSGQVIIWVDRDKIVAEANKRLFG